MASEPWWGRGLPTRLSSAVDSPEPPCPKSFLMKHRKAYFAGGESYFGTGSQWQTCLFTSSSSSLCTASPRGARGGGGAVLAVASPSRRGFRDTIRRRCFSTMDSDSSRSVVYGGGSFRTKDSASAAGAWFPAGRLGSRVGTSRTWPG